MAQKPHQAGHAWQFLQYLLGFRALQAIGGAAALIAAFAVLDAGSSRSGRRLWIGGGPFRRRGQDRALRARSSIPSASRP